ncbi:MAG: SDR family oxidoreductase [Burkholderiales bacterium]|jgi:NAD(P)-dependent dehydrogenase (short-subunit alcohol dehydrogenase family)|nr:SDR family oxidoreductase [Burkholderiales bacterium]
MSNFAPDYLAGRRFLVTGASSGIGRAAGALLAACGASVTASGRDEQRLAEAIAQWPGDGHLARPVALDKADEAASWMKSLVDEHGAFDGIFHAAGIELIRPVRLTKQAQLDEVFGAAVFAAAGLARAASQKGGLKDEGALVFMSSVAGSSGQVGMTAYSAAKAAIDGMVRSLACEFAPRRIRVNAIAAGAVQTAMHERLTHGAAQDIVETYRDRHLLGFGEPEDIANAAAFLLGPAGRWITGTTWVVDGGYLCK